MARKRDVLGGLLASPLVIVIALVLLLLLAGKATVEIGKLVTAARQTGNPDVDAFAWKIARGVLAEWGPLGTGPNGEPLEAVAFLAAELVDRESKGNARNFLGDATLGGGPSIGPMQVYRSTAKELGLWTPSDAAAGDEAAERAEYAELAQDTAWGIRAGIAVMKSKQDILTAYVAAHPGTTRTLQDLARLYNGGGDKARQYAAAVADESARDVADWMSRRDYAPATDSES